MNWSQPIHCHLLMFCQYRCLAHVFMYLKPTLYIFKDSPPNFRTIIAPLLNLQLQRTYFQPFLTVAIFLEQPLLLYQSSILTYIIQLCAWHMVPLSRHLSTLLNCQMGILGSWHQQQCIICFITLSFITISWRLEGLIPPSHLQPIS